MIIGEANWLGSFDNPEQNTEELRGIGMRLAEASNHVLYEGDKRVGPVTMGDLMEDWDDAADGNDWVRSGTAIMLENVRKYIGAMDETTRLVNIGDFQKYAFNMVRALFPSLAAHEFASVQPMAGPVSLVFFMKFIYNLTKGTALAGQDIIENPNETYSSEVIDDENLGTGDGATTNFTGNLSFTPVKPGTVEILTTDASSNVLTVTDDGNGNLVGSVGAASTINYTSGAFNVTFSAAPGNGDQILATYSYDNEANDTIPDVDLTLTSSPVTAITRKLRTRWSVESQQDLKNLHGLDAEIEQVAGITSELKFEIDREVIRDIKNLTANTVTAFSRTPPASVSFTEHKLLFVDKLLEASNTIFNTTQRAVGTWVNAGVNTASLIESLPGFVGAGKPPNTRGIYKSGRLNNQWDIWKDPTYPSDAGRNQFDPNGWLMGYKGVSMWEVGYIFAPYILAFTTPTVMLDDFVGRKGIASRYGKKSIDGRFYAKSSVTGNPFS
ncbi:MAG: hypothetical protein MJA83_17725 [Gammaproteobacteria bacterium]|nr:hypothetical protein [Gammaproteobacteria bacterium]